MATPLRTVGLANKVEPFENEIWADAVIVNNAASAVSKTLFMLCDLQR